ncbi:MAG TPA: NUDIX hydrolase [Acidimicrobiales bacterium]|nr:NUDIX hydrolase [Acidimicrobiales bacterium]
MAAIDDDADPAAGFTVVREDEMWRGHIVRLCHLELTDPAGVHFERDVVRHPGAVAVVPMTDDGTVTLVRQYRAAVGRSVLEVPAGTCDVDGEALEKTARRELVEEAGLEAAQVEPLARVYNSPGYSDQVTTIFLARGLRPCPTGRTGVEEQHMTVEEVDVRRAHALVAEGRVVDETTALGLLLARDAHEGHP